MTRFAEGKVNKLCPAAGTQSRGTSSCWGWASSSRLVTKNAEPSDRGALFSSQKIPVHPGKLSSQRPHCRVLQLCPGLSLKLGNSQWAQVLRANILLSVLSWAVSQCSEQSRLLRFRGLGHNFIYSTHQTRACVDDHPYKSFLYAYKID